MRSFSRHLPRFAYAALAAGCCLLVLLPCGCGKSRPQTVPIAGRVTLDGGPWQKAGVLLFHPVDVPAGQASIPGSADFSPDGAFVVSTFKEGDGLLPGRYKVTADCWEERPHDGFAGKNCYVPQPYRDPKTTPLEIAVALGAKQTDVHLDVASAKKR